MKRWLPLVSVAALLSVAACVTINVYFPAAVAERVADQFVQDVYGPTSPDADAPKPSSTTSPRSSLKHPGHLLYALLNFVIPAAHAQADFDINTAAIQQIKASLQKRHKELEAFYTSGAIGLAANGDIAVKELGAVPLAQRNTLRKLVADENAERTALYREIALANGRADWEPEIRTLFAARWIANARPGWSIQAPGGEWKTK